MNIQSFWEHHGILRNPFAEEDAQTDPVFKEFCISSAYHPTWDKIYGDPTEPSTAIIFGPKGSGKTAMRLQIDRHLNKYNQENPNKRVYVIRYDDFNPFLDHFAERVSRFTAKKPEKVLDNWRLWDHMDSILCLGVTDLVNQIIHSGENNDPTRAGMQITSAQLAQLDRNSARDIMLLATCYDHRPNRPSLLVGINCVSEFVSAIGRRHWISFWPSLGLLRCLRLSCFFGTAIPSRIALRCGSPPC